MSSPQNGLSDLSVLQTVQVNDCLLSVSAGVGEGIKHENSVGNKCLELQSNFYLAEDKVVFYRDVIIQKLLSDVDDYSSPDDPSMMVGRDYILEVFKYYIANAKVNSSAIVKVLMMKFDKNSENNHIISQLLLIMASYLTDSDGISLFHFCINNLIDISNMSVSIEVRDMVQLLGILQQKYEKQIESSVIGKFYTELALKGFDENGSTVLLLCLCVLPFRQEHFSKEIPGFLLKCVNSNESLVIRRTLFIYDKIINYQESQLQFLYKNDIAFLNVFTALEFEHELHLIEQLFPTISKLIKIATNFDLSKVDNRKVVDLVTWDHLEPLFFRLFSTTNSSPTVTKLSIMSLFNGKLGFEPKNIDRIPRKCIGILLETLNALGGNVNIHKKNKKNEHISLHNELSSFVENLVIQTESLYVLELLDGFKFAMTIATLRGIAEGIKSIAPYKNLNHLSLCTDLVHYHYCSNVSISMKQELVDIFAEIITNFVRPDCITKLSTILKVVDYSTDWCYHKNVENWLCLNPENAVQAIDQKDKFEIDALANLICYSSAVTYCLSYACENQDHRLLHLVLIRNPPFPSLGISKQQIESIVSSSIDKILALVDDCSNDDSNSSSVKLVEHSQFLATFRKYFQSNYIPNKAYEIIEKSIAHQNRIIQIIGLHSAIEFVTDFSRILEIIMSSSKESFEGLNRKEVTIYNICKWSILKVLLPTILQEKSSVNTELSKHILDMAEIDLLTVPTNAIFSILDCSFFCARYTICHMASFRVQVETILSQYWDEIRYLKGTVTACNFQAYAYRFIDLLSDDRLLIHKDLVFQYFEMIILMKNPSVTRKLLGNFVLLWLKHKQLLPLYQEHIFNFSISKEERVEPAYENFDLLFESNHLELLKKTDYYSLNRAIILSFITQLSDRSVEVDDFVEFMVLHLLQVGASNENGRDNLLIGSSAYSRKLRCWQVLYVLCPIIPTTSSNIRKMLPLLGIGMSLNLHSKIRHFMELFIIKLAVKCHGTLESDEGLILDWLMKEISCPTLTLQHISSLMIILGWLLVSGLITSKDNIQRLICSTVPWLGATQGFTRGIAQLLVHELVPLIDEPKDESNLLYHLFNYLSENNDMKKLRRKQIKFFAKLEVNHSLETLLSIPVDESNEPSPISGIEIIENSLRECYNEKHSISNDEDSDIPLWKQLERLTVKDEINFNNYDENDANFQRKIIPLDLLHLTVYEELRKSNINSAGNVKQSLIICASLIDKTPNLAGLCRTAEIFAAESIVVPDISIRNRDDFKGMSVGAGDHVKIEECKEEDLMKWLQMKKNRGYSIVGIEQTASSQCISKFIFPDRVVLLLGKEKEGIPVEFLQIIDVCIEIPQLGIIRSLNVHVSGAIAIWEYTRQQLTS